MIHRSKLSSFFYFIEIVIVTLFSIGICYFLFPFSLFIIPIIFLYFGALYIGSLLFFCLLIYYLCFPIWCYYVLLSLFAVIYIPFLRIRLVSSVILKLIDVLGMIPKISKTEEIALSVGTKWIDAELFSGTPKFKSIFNYPMNSLTKEEKDFIDNQVTKVCSLCDDWKISQDRDLSEEVWDFLKKEKFFGLIIPKKFDGLGFSYLANSEIVSILASRSQALAITVMVPNSLGPGELLIKYGTSKQKDYFLPRLAKGIDIPCFGLTEEKAGSDANSISSKGVLFNDNGTLKIRLNWEKRYITLGEKATVIGLAFKLEDPDNLLNKGCDLGINCALVKNSLEGVIQGRRHDPLGVPFINSPISGKDVVITLDDIIGGEKQIGKGWEMLMECLAVGRGISLPAISSGGARLTCKISSYYSCIRKQFSQPLINFEGIQKPLVRINAATYALEAMRVFTATAVDKKEKPSVANAIIKYHSTEMLRDIVNDSMDILAGKAIIRGKRNFLYSVYVGVPIGITVEGANIITRSLMQFGQGAVICHPYLYDEMRSLVNKDLKLFDKSLYNHLALISKKKVHYMTAMFSIALSSFSFNKNCFSKYQRRLKNLSAIFAFLSEVSIMKYTSKIKVKEALNSRFGDILSYLFIATCSLRKYKEENNIEHKQLVEWILNDCLKKSQEAIIGICNNFCGLYGFFFKYVIGRFHRIFPLITCYNDDKQDRIIANKIQHNKDYLSYCSSIYPAKELSIYEEAYNQTYQIKDIEKKIRNEYKKDKKIKFYSLDKLCSENIIDKKELEILKNYNNLVSEIIKVDDFSVSDYLKNK